MEPCSQEQRISRIEQAVNAIDQKVEGLVLEFQLFKAKMDSVLNSVEEHDRALKGNNGTVGLIAKVANALDVLYELNAALKGREEKPGLIATIDRLSKTVECWNDDRKWITRLVIGWVITTILGLVVIALK